MFLTKELFKEVKNINNFFEKEVFTFIKINHEILNKDNKKSKFDLKFIISEAVKSYVRRISILEILERLIKSWRELLILEGDPFNGQKLKIL